MKIDLWKGASAFALMAGLAMPGQALAQTAPTASPPSEQGLQEIVVTAQKRAESAQNVPVAITAFSGAALQEKGVTDLSGLAGQAPSVTLKNTASFGGSTATLYSYIRGIGQNDFAFNLDPGVGVYVDGVFLARNIGANVDLLDLNRVEVLKGPQGTLFGRNTIGGAISIVTRDPGNTFKINAEATTGSYNRADFRGTADIPIVSDVLRASISVSTAHRDGWQKRIAYTGYTDQNPIYLLATNGAFGGPTNTNASGGGAPGPVVDSTAHNDAGNQNQTSVRAKLLFTPNDRLTIRLIGDYLHVNQAAAPFSLLQVNQTAYVAIYNACITGNQQLITGFTALAGFPGIPSLCNNQRGNPASPTGVKPSLASLAGTLLPYDNRYVVHNADGSINPNASYASGPNFDKVENWGLNFQTEYKLTDNLDLKSITAYRHLNSSFGADIGGAPFAALDPTFADQERQFTEELQAVGKAFDSRWKYVFGAYYFHEWGHHQDQVPFIGGLIQITSNDPYDTKSYALYTHNNIEIIPDKLSLTLGARYTHDSKKFTGTQRDENEFGGQLLNLPPFVFPNPSDVYVLYPLGQNKLAFNNFSFRVGAEYKFDRHIMAYASYATGYKGGGWTTRLTVPNFNTTTFQPLPAPTFGPETAKTAEIGLKSEFLDRRVRLNVAAFHTIYDNMQLTFQNSASPVTANGGNGRIVGFEAELNTQLTPEWSFDASASRLDAKYTKVLPGAPLTLSDQFVNTPKWALAAGTSYRIDLPGHGSLTPRLDWTYTSQVFNDEANTPILATPAHSMVNASLTYHLPGDKFELQAGVTNMFDKRVVASGYTNNLAIYAGTYNAPREWFLTLRIHD